MIEGFCHAEGHDGSALAILPKADEYHADKVYILHAAEYDALTSDLAAALEKLASVEAVRDDLRTTISYAVYTRLRDELDAERLAHNVTRAELEEARKEYIAYEIGTAKERDSLKNEVERLRGGK